MWKHVFVQKGVDFRTSENYAAYLINIQDGFEWRYVLSIQYYRRVYGVQVLLVFSESLNTSIVSSFRLMHFQLKTSEPAPKIKGGISRTVTSEI